MLTAPSGCCLSLSHLLANHLGRHQFLCRRPPGLSFSLLLFSSLSLQRYISICATVFVVVIASIATAISAVVAMSPRSPSPLAVLDEGRARTRSASQAGADLRRCIVADRAETMPSFTIDSIAGSHCAARQPPFWPRPAAAFRREGGRRSRRRHGDQRREEGRRRQEELGPAVDAQALRHTAGPPYAGPRSGTGSRTRSRRRGPPSTRPRPPRPRASRPRPRPTPTPGRP